MRAKSLTGIVVVASLALGLSPAMGAEKGDNASRIAADSRDFLLNVDAVGNDFRIYPIANCGKGQPMQSKKLGNGGPTLRSRARVTGG